MSITPDGREWDVMAILIHRISWGRIVEERSANSVNLVLEDLQQELRERERIEQELQVAGASSKLRSPRRCPRWRAGGSRPITGRPGRWEETSTTSTSSPRANWGLW